VSSGSVGKAEGVAAGDREKDIRELGSQKRTSARGMACMMFVLERLLEGENADGLRTIPMSGPPTASWKMSDLVASLSEMV